MLRSKRLRTLLAAFALAGLLIPATGGSAGAVSPLPIVCTAAGTVTFINGGTDQWTVAGQGSCQGDLEGTYILRFIGKGTSDTLGLCDEGLLVQNLGIVVVGSLTNLSGSGVVPKTFVHVWTAPVTTYPIVTPYLIFNTGGDPIGAGAFFNHIFLMCSGPSVAQFTFAFLT
ncbi:MAG: hypothetical protein ACRDKG_02375 [Actinomycetota bacterium]